MRVRVCARLCRRHSLTHQILQPNTITALEKRTIFVCSCRYFSLSVSVTFSESNICVSVHLSLAAALSVSEWPFVSTHCVLFPVLVKLKLKKVVLTNFLFTFPLRVGLLPWDTQRWGGGASGMPFSVRCPLNRQTHLYYTTTHLSFSNNFDLHVCCFVQLLFG